MKAVNLIPAEERRGPSAGGRSGNAAYVVLGVLGVLVLMLAAWTLTGKTVKNRTAQLADVEQQASATEAQASKLAAYATFADLRKNRAETVSSIARSRFDWAHVMHEVARVIPPDTHLTSLSGTVSPTPRRRTAVARPCRCAARTRGRRSTSSAAPTGRPTCRG